MLAQGRVRVNNFFSRLPSRKLTGKVSHLFNSTLPVDATDLFFILDGILEVLSESQSSSGIHYGHFRQLCILHS